MKVKAVSMTDEEMAKPEARVRLYRDRNGNYFACCETAAGSSFCTGTYTMREEVMGDLAHTLLGKDVEGLLSW